MLNDIAGDTYDPTRLPSKGRAPAAPGTASERFWLEAEATITSVTEGLAQYKKYDKIIQQLYEIEGVRYSNPNGLTEENFIDEEGTGMYAPGGGVATKAEARKTLSEAIERARAKNWKISTLEEADKLVETEAYDRSKAARSMGLTSSAWTGPAAFGGMMFGAVQDPFVIATLPFGASARLSGSIAYRILKAMSQEFLIGSGVQAGVEIATGSFKERAGIEDSAIANILAAGLGGAVLAGGLRGVAETVRGRYARGMGLSLDELDSLAVGARKIMDTETAPPGVPLSTHVDNLEKATHAVARGRPIENLIPWRDDGFIPGDAKRVAEIVELKSELGTLQERLAAIPEGVGDKDIIQMAARLADLEKEISSVPATPENVARLIEETKFAREDREVSEAALRLAGVTAEEGFPRKAAKIETYEGVKARSGEINKRIDEIIQDRSDASQILSLTGQFHKVAKGGMSEWEPGNIVRAEQTRAEARVMAGKMLERPPQEKALAAVAELGEARRAAVENDRLVSFEGKSVKASTMLENAAEEKRVANEIANACLLAGGALE